MILTSSRPRVRRGGSMVCASDDDDDDDEDDDVCIGASFSDMHTASRTPS